MSESFFVFGVSGLCDWDFLLRVHYPKMPNAEPQNTRNETQNTKKMSITILIIAITAIVSFVAFSNGEWMYKLRQWPYQEARQGEYYRWLTNGLVHANPMHLIFNMLTLYVFGQFVEEWFLSRFGTVGPVIYLLFYVLALAASSSATFYKYKNTPGYTSIGASGATAAILFASILINPTNELYLMFIPIGIPGFIFGPLYLWYSNYSANRGNDNIDHMAHFFGALFGFFVPLILEPTLIVDFFSQLTGWFHYVFGS